MTRLATLLCLLVLAGPVEASEPGRVIYRVQAGPPAAKPWTLHPILSLPTPLSAVSDRETTDGGNTVAFFARLTGLGFHCLAFEPPRRRLRRVEVVCARDGWGEWFSYAGGWPLGGGVFIVDRIRTGRESSAELLGGAQVGAHLRAVLGGPNPERLMTMREAPVR